MHSFICLAYVLILPGRSSSDAVKQFESHAVAWTGHAWQIVAASCHSLLTGHIASQTLPVPRRIKELSSRQSKAIKAGTVML